MLVDINLIRKLQVYEVTTQPNITTTKQKGFRKQNVRTGNRKAKL